MLYRDVLGCSRLNILELFDSSLRFGQPQAMDRLSGNDMVCRSLSKKSANIGLVNRNAAMPNLNIVSDRRPAATSGWLYIPLLCRFSVILRLQFLDYGSTDFERVDIFEKGD